MRSHIHYMAWHIRKYQYRSHCFRQYLLGGDAWSAAQALQAGLVNRVAPPDEVDAWALAAARAAARTPLDGVAMSKLLLEAFLDTQGVGQDFDMAGFHADAMQLAMADSAGHNA